MTFFSCNVLKCVSMNNQECKVRAEMLNTNSNEPSFYPYSTLANIDMILIKQIHKKNVIFAIIGIF